MKRFFIFAAMLLTLTAKAVNTDDNPPKVLPPVDHIILTPTDMMDKDRSIAACWFSYDCTTDMIELTCIGTGCCTDLYILDQYGNEVDHCSLNSDFTVNAVLDAADASGDCRIILISEKYYGEATVSIR